MEIFPYSIRLCDAKKIMLKNQAANTFAGETNNFIAVLQAGCN